MTRIVEKIYSSENGTTIRLWYSTHTGNGTVYFTFEGGTKAHEHVNLYGKGGQMALFTAEKVLGSRYFLEFTVRKG